MQLDLCRNNDNTLEQRLEEISEGEELSFEVELRAAETSEGGVDGPVSLRVLRVPPGMNWTQLESANPQLSNRFEFYWETSAGDAGEHLIRLMGISPSGIEQIAERTIRVEEAKELRLATLGGGTERATFSLFSYLTDDRTRQARLQRLSSVEVGRGVGHILLERDQYFVSVPTSGKVAVINALSGELQRLIPIGGEPYALASSADYIWGFNGRSSDIFAVDRKLKIYRRSTIDDLSGYIISALGITTPVGERIAALSSGGELVLLDPEAFVSNQPSRAVTHRLHLTSYIQPLLTSPQTHHPVGGGLFKTESDILIAYTTRGAVALDINTMSSDSLSPMWCLKSAATIGSMTTHQDKIWAVSSQGLRRFEWPTSGQGLEPNAPYIEGVILDLNQLSVIEALPGPLMGEATLVTATSRQLNHISSDSLRPILSAAGVNLQRLLITEHDTQ